MQNTIQLIQLDAADWGVSPTRWQWSRYPEWAQSRISVIHEGIDTAIASPHGPADFTPARWTHADAGGRGRSFVARNLEPYRGFPQFMRALPAFQKLRPQGACRGRRRRRRLLRPRARRRRQLARGDAARTGRPPRSQPHPLHGPRAPTPTCSACSG
ncbi:hypothetical protein [Sediminicoccus sp. BL-A-41-H5]|uniref:hypothetical protein n=1 Tax=Sediminicoccus sp. BL-A-41-H5 TaxID=3421106 RepID=UPI003D667590